jgi:hypothetical protein
MPPPPTPGHRELQDSSGQVTVTVDDECRIVRVGIQSTWRDHLTFNEATKLVGDRGRSAIAAQEEWLAELPRAAWPRPDAGLSVGSSWPDGDA